MGGSQIISCSMSAAHHFFMGNMLLLCESVLKNLYCKAASMTHIHINCECYFFGFLCTFLALLSKLSKIRIFLLAFPIKQHTLTSCRVSHKRINKDQA